MPESLTPEQVLAKYENLKIQERAIKAEMEELEPALEEIIPRLPEDQEIQGAQGYFFIQKRPTWKFSETVNQKEAELKKLKSEEQAKGIAIPKYKPILYYKSSKEAEE